MASRITRSRVRSAEEIRRVLQAAENVDELPNDSSSDSEVDHEEELEGSDTSTESEKESSNDEVSQEAERAKKPRTSRNTAVSTSTNNIYGKNRYKWSLIPPAPRSRSTTPASQDFGPCGIGDAANVSNEGQTWSLLLPDPLLEKVVTYTNQTIAQKWSSSQEDLTYTHDLDILELKALLGLLYFSGLQGITRRNIKVMYGKLSSPIFRATMPRQRFEFLLSHLRFDDKSTRGERKKTDKLAAIREIWDNFISNSKNYFKPGETVTIDEQLLSFRGRCAFRVYIKSKPDKYGLKIVCLNDSETSYLIDGIPYIGKVATTANESVPEYYVRKLSESITGSKRNITCDNWFTSIPLIERIGKEHSLTVVGTIRKNKREIPEVMKSVTEVRGSKFAYANNMTLVSHCPKKNKVVLAVSSLHTVGKISSDRGKPDIILYYNKTKGATDTFDQMCHE